MKDHETVELLQRGERIKAFNKLYRAYPQVQKMICKNGGAKQDAEDIFQEALLIFYRKVMSDDFQLTSAISTYIYSICRFLWKDELKKRNKLKQSDYKAELNPVEEESITELIKKESHFTLIEEALKQIGDKCLKLLQLFYYNKLSMKEIALKVGLKSENVAKNQKYKCLERAKLKLIELRANNTFKTI